MKVHYHGKLADGSTFDSSANREPLEFKIGSGMVIKGFDDGVTGMAVGDKKTIFIPAIDAYGELNPEQILSFPIERFPPDLKPTVGMTLQMNDGQGHALPVVITAVSDTEVTLDANHPLAGKDLTFDLELMSIDGGLIILP